MTNELLVIAGAGPGLGTAVALRFGREGARVALLARTADRLDGLVGDLRGRGVDAHALTVDLADPVSVGDCLDAVRDRFGDPGVLVYNASRYIGGAPTTVEVEDLVQGFRVGVAGALATVRQVAPAMRAAGRGTVLLTGSGVGVRPFVGSAALGVQKAGLRNLASTLADELEPDGVHVAMITIDGVIGQGAGFAPEEIAEEFWAVYLQPQGAWERERVIGGEAPPT